MSSGFDKYEQECEKIREENETLLLDFIIWLRGKGISEKTVRKHYENIFFYLDEYLLYDDATPAVEGVYMVDGFLGYWFIRKALWASESSIRSNAASLKKFYTFMFEENHLKEKDALDELKTGIKESLTEWIATLRRFDDPDIEDYFEI